MIKVDKGRIQVHGDRAEVMAELSLLIGAVKKTFEKEYDAETAAVLVIRAFTAAMEKEAENGSTGEV